MAKLLFVASIAVVRPVDESIHAIEHDVKTRTMVRVNFGAEVDEQRLDFTPMNVAAHSPVENRLQQVFVLVTHDYDSSLDTVASILQSPRQCDPMSSGKSEGRTGFPR
jgi:hypothetical protein